MIQKQEQTLGQIVEEAVDDFLSEDISKLLDNTFRAVRKFCIAFVKGWIKGAGFEGRWTNEEVKEEVERCLKKRILNEIERCMELSEDPFEFKNWIVIKGRY